MENFLKELPKLAKEKEVESKKYFQKLKKRTPKNLDLIMQELHDDEFEKTDCLTCGNCCKTTSPIFTIKDIERISKHFRMKVLDFTNEYLKSIVSFYNKIQNEKLSKIKDFEDEGSEAAVNCLKKITIDIR